MWGGFEIRPSLRLPREGGMQFRPTLAHWTRGRFWCKTGIMHRKLPLFLFGLLALIAPVEAQESLFNGKDLTGWKGLPQFWSVKDGIIVGETTAENPTKGNTFLVWQGGEVADFEITAEVRFKGNNSGLQYRSGIVDDAPHSHQPHLQEH